MALDILSVVHVNVNCSDLARSKAFYGELLGLTSQTHTLPSEPQDGEGFGMSGKVLWDAHMMHDSRGQAGPCIDLLEWQIPKPSGRPYPSANHLGFGRICLSVRDLDAFYERLRSQGVDCLGAPTTARVNDEVTAKVLCLRDPDGTLLEVVEDANGPDVRLVHVNVNCSDVAQSSAWYQRVLGFDRVGGSSPGPSDGAVLGLPGQVEWDAHFLAPRRAPDSFMIDLLEWKEPKPVGRPYADANNLGIFRMAFLVESCAESYEELKRLGVDCPPPAWLEMGPEIPIDGLWALFFPDPDGTCLELIESPVQRG